MPTVAHEAFAMDPYMFSLLSFCTVLLESFARVALRTRTRVSPEPPNTALRTVYRSSVLSHLLLNIPP